MAQSKKEIHTKNPKEIASQLDDLANHRARGDLKVKDDEEVVKIVFRGHSAEEGGFYIAIERLTTLWSSDRIGAGKDVTVSWQGDGGVFSFDSYTTDEEGKDGLIKLRFPEQVTRVQKRRFYRASAPPSPPFTVIINTERKPVEFFVEDISAGGLALLTDLGKDILHEGMKLRDLQFTLPDGYTVTTSILVRYLFPTDYPDPKRRFRCGVMFVDISEQDQEKIVKYVFTRQREELKAKR